MNGRTVWVKTDDVDGPLDEGHVVKATHPLSDFCLRGDDGSEPVAAGTLLEIVETRPWGAAMAQELSDLHTMDAMMTGDPDENMAQVQAEVDELLGVTDVDTSPESILEAMTDLEQIGLWEFAEAAG